MRFGFLRLFNTTVIIYTVISFNIIYCILVYYTIRYILYCIYSTVLGYFNLLSNTV